MQRNLKLQPAVDFLSSYGMAIIIISVAFIAVYGIAFNQPNTPSCTAPPGFACDFMAINSSGVLTARISQAIGSEIVINGAACAEQQNASTDAPADGNPSVGNNIATYPQPYTISGHYPPGNIMYSSSTYIFYVYCYDVNGGIAKGSADQQFTGYLWLNYTVPGYKYQVQKVAVFTAEYS